MKRTEIYLGNAIIKSAVTSVHGGFVEIDGEKFYKISHCNRMPDFFMTIVSDSDHWMFLSSNGSLSAGRKNRDNALFPYYTVDKIHDYKGLTGSKSCFLVNTKEKTFLWEPFTDEAEKVYTIERNLYKSIFGNKIIFEEINHDLGLGFQYGWYNSERFGFIKQSLVTNLSNEAIQLELLDGLKNILPYGVDCDFQNAYSNLLDAYKKSELIEESKLGLFILSSIPVDRAEPSEALKATTVWSYGLTHKQKTLISDKQIENFVNGLPVRTEIDIRASRGAYFINAELELAPAEKQKWLFVADVNQDRADVANLNLLIKSEKNIGELIWSDIKEGTENLKRIVSKADGMQKTNEDLCSARHFSNTLYNVMRGGLFMNNFSVDISDFKLFVSQANKNISGKFESWLNQLPAEINNIELIKQAEGVFDSDLLRICYEYLPLTFSRRHGDPSRPWNLFSIDTKNSDGSPKLNYQGNWRDIFQNWEALSYSYPDYLEGMISKFLNASTPDGYNPYRVTREGIDWESPDPHDPWAYIGYWGDHQIIYLLKFLELSKAFHPGKLQQLMAKEIFVYANVPYQIKSYQEIVTNPQDTIKFDYELNDKVKQLIKEIGADGSLLMTNDQSIYRVNLTEKILVTLLAKLSNFIPEAGIWLNTQRPEWNDANNALVGNGASMVTLYYLRRFLKFWEVLLSDSDNHEILISEEVKILLDEVTTLFVDNKALLNTGFSNSDRRLFADRLGEAGSNYRNCIYQNSFSGKKKVVSTQTLLAFMRIGLEYLDQSIKANKREDGLYHAYNLISFTDQSISIRYLYEMLEGQVAVLSSGYLSVQQCLDVLNALKCSQLFRADQYSYLLYPDRQLPLFVQKNNIPENFVSDSKLLSKLVSNRDTSILNRDNSGHFHFNGLFRNGTMLRNALDKLDSTQYATLVSDEKETILAVYEKLFDHQSFTGRSGTFYGYEGLGSIYWHMVSKLLLAAQEGYIRGVAEGAHPDILNKIKDHYYEIKAGIGLYKSPELYGAFPTDAYSHTPGHAGAQQPGMTGQVKEDFISRMGELGVRIQDGEIRFNPSLLNPDELLKEQSQFEYFDLYSIKRLIELSKGSLAFTFCQVPVICSKADEDQIVVTDAYGNKTIFDGNSLDKEISDQIFNRSGYCRCIEVNFTNLGKNQ